MINNNGMHQDQEVNLFDLRIRFPSRTRITWVYSDGDLVQSFNVMFYDTGILQMLDIRSGEAFYVEDIPAVMEPGATEVDGDDEAFRLMGSVFREVDVRVFRFPDTAGKITCVVPSLENRLTYFDFHYNRRYYEFGSLRNDVTASLLVDRI